MRRLGHASSEKDDSVQVDVPVLDLRGCVSRKIMLIPARGMNCTHEPVEDLLVLLQWGMQQWVSEARKAARAAAATGAGPGTAAQWVQERERMQEEAHLRNRAGMEGGLKAWKCPKPKCLQLLTPSTLCVVRERVSREEWGWCDGGRGEGNEEEDCCTIADCRPVSFKPASSLPFSSLRLLPASPSSCHRDLCIYLSSFPPPSLPLCRIPTSLRSAGPVLKAGWRGMWLICKRFFPAAASSWGSWRCRSGCRQQFLLAEVFVLS